MIMLIKMIKTRKKRKAYRNYIKDHKRLVLRAFYEMLQCKNMEWIMSDKEIMDKLWIRALEHDDSKFDKKEFEPYRKHYFPINEKEKIENEPFYKAAWEHHKKHNDHHWQHRTNWKDEDFDINTELACLENVMDWLAVGYRFHNRPYEYYEKHKSEIKLPKKQIEFIEKCIYQGVDKEILLKKDKTYDFWNRI